jgi:osmotically-inducible protein OsmY
MNRANLFSMIAAISLVVAPSADAQRSAGESVDDTTIALSVKAALVDSDAVEAGKVNVEVHKRIVQLSGYVPTDDQKSAALAIADRVEGISGVADLSGIGEAFGVVTHVRNGEVLLSGFVETDQLRKDIVAAAESVDGVAKVHDRIAVRP